MGATTRAYSIICKCLRIYEFVEKKLHARVIDTFRQDSACNIYQAYHKSIGDWLMINYSIRST